jgi:hypothetical protein
MATNCATNWTSAAPAVIPNRSNRKPPFSFSRRLYKLRSRIEQRKTLLRASDRQFRPIIDGYVVPKVHMPRCRTPYAPMSHMGQVTIVADPVGAGYVDSLAHPGGNATGQERDSGSRSKAQCGGSAKIPSYWRLQRGKTRRRGRGRTGGEGGSAIQPSPNLHCKKTTWKSD